MGTLDAVYKSYQIETSSEIEPFNRYIEVYGVKIAGLKATGGKVAVEDEFIRKIAETVKILLDPNGEYIDSESQKKAIQKLKEINTLQRVGVEEYNSYSPRLDEGRYAGWDETNATHSTTDFIWQFNLPGDTIRTTQSQITEVLEHLLHTLVRFALPGAFPNQFLLIEYWDKDQGKINQELELSGLLYEASKEAIENGVFNASDYEIFGKDSSEYWKNVMTEYQYALTFAEWGFIQRFVQNGSLDPEWSDNYLTPDKIKEGNPLGHSLYENYIKKVISKPSSNELEEIFKENNQGLSGYIANTGSSSNDELTGSSSNETFFASEGSDTINGKGGNDTYVYSGKFSDYSFTREVNSLTIADQGTGINDGTDTLSNIEYIQFSDQKVDESKVDVVKEYSGKFSDYKFYNKGNDVYQIKTDSGYDDITGFPLLTFTGEVKTSSFKNISAIADIKGTFDQVTGLNTDSGRMFRLYNASFKRLPDSDGLAYWIDNFSSGRNSIRVVASSFLGSVEFTEKYGSNVSDETYVNNLYKNVLGRDADNEGLNYWVGNLSSGIETRYEALLGFAESAENKALFTDMTGFG